MVFLGKFDIFDHVDMLKCPLCGSDMTAMGYSIACTMGHNFDLSKRGYVNFLLKPARMEYGKDMFKSRSIMSQRGLFYLMIRHINNIVLSAIPPGEPFKILDAGCGEGSHLVQILEAVNGFSDARATGFGIDISKDGIQVAARNSSHLVWCVADLADIPFKNQRFDVILSIFSPSNYAEFSRLLVDEGLLIKVVPESDYLRELRHLLYKGTDKQTYSNEKVIEHFKNNFRLLNIQRATYNFPLGDNDLEHLIIMTPLSWGASQEAIDTVIAKGIDNITVDFTIIVGKKYGSL